MSSTSITPNLVHPPLARPGPLPVVPRWLHYWALLTVFCALPLVLLGAEVTTKKVGMVDPQGFREPWHLFTLPLRELGLGYLIEHSHRLFGFLVGTCSIVLALGLSFTARRPLPRWIGWAALAAVSFQGVLGIARVKYNALSGPELALVHGCTAQLVFALLVSVTVITSRSWYDASATAAVSPGLRRLAVALPILVYAQIVFGAILRHLYLFSALLRVAQRLHFLMAFVVLGCVLLLVVKLKQAGPDLVGVRRWGKALEVLVALQILLGVEAWFGRFGSGVAVELQQSTPALDLVRSGHFVIGLLLFSTTVVVSLLVNRASVPGRVAQEAA